MVLELTITLLIIPGVSFSSDLLVLISDVGRLARVEADRRARAHGTTRAQWLILAWLNRQPGLSQKELAEKLEVEPITVARLVDRLEARGLLERRPDPADRRVWRLHLLPGVEPLLDELDRVRECLFADLTARLSPADIETAVSVLSTMRATLSRSVSARNPEAKKNLEDA